MSSSQPSSRKIEIGEWAPLAKTVILSAIILIGFVGLLLFVYRGQVVVPNLVSEMIHAHHTN